jgi:2,3-bisphosphoglycerate-independent phosphoglycerate mutase
MGSGLDMEPGDVAFKSNFASLSADGINVALRRVDRNFPSWGLPLCDALNGITLPSFPDISVAVQYATEHRCAIVLIFGSCASASPLSNVFFFSR